MWGVHTRIYTRVVGGILFNLLNFTLLLSGPVTFPLLLLLYGELPAAPDAPPKTSLLVIADSPLFERFIPVIGAGLLTRTLGTAIEDLKLVETLPDFCRNTPFALLNLLSL